MIDHNDRARLDAIAAAVWSEDPRFATALGMGRPRAPREYRRRRWFALLIAVVLIVLGAVAGLLPPLLIFGVPIGAAAYALAQHAKWPDRPAGSH